MSREYEKRKPKGAKGGRGGQFAKGNNAYVHLPRDSAGLYAEHGDAVEYAKRQNLYRRPAQPKCPRDNGPIDPASLDLDVYDLYKCLYVYDGAGDCRIHIYHWRKKWGGEWKLIGATTPAYNEIAAFKRAQNKITTYRNRKKLMGRWPKYSHE